MQTLTKEDQVTASKAFETDSKSSLSSYIKAFLFLAIVIASIIYNNIDMGNVFHRLHDITFIFLILLFILFLVVELIQVPIISILMKHFNVKMPFNFVYSINLISGFYSLTPLGGLAGGFVRWYRLGKKDNKHSEVFTAIVIQKVLSILSLLCFGLLVLIIKDPFKTNATLSNLIMIVSGVLFLGIIISFFIVTHQKIMTYLHFFLVRPTLKTLPSMIASPFRKVWSSVKKYRGAYKPLIFSFFFALLYKLGAFFLFYATLLVIGVDLSLVNASVLYFVFHGTLEILPIMSVFTLLVCVEIVPGIYTIPHEEALIHGFIMASFFFLIGGLFELIEKIGSRKSREKLS